MRLAAIVSVGALALSVVRVAQRERIASARRTYADGYELALEFANVLNLLSAPRWLWTVRPLASSP